MEIKKILLVPILCLLLCSCSMFENDYVCEKKLKDDNYYYDIKVDVTFDGNGLLTNLKSTATYHLREDGLDKTDTFKELLDEKNDKYSSIDGIDVSYEIKDTEVYVYEDIDVNDEFINKYKDLVTVYLGNERGITNVIGSFEENEFVCEKR